MVSSHPGITCGALLAWSHAGRFASACSVVRCAWCCGAGTISAPHCPGVFEGCSAELPQTRRVGDPNTGCLPWALTPHWGRGDVPVRDSSKCTRCPCLSQDRVRAQDTEGSDAAAAGKPVLHPAHACTSAPVSLHACVRLRSGGENRSPSGCCVVTALPGQQVSPEMERAALNRACSVHSGCHFLLCPALGGAQEPVCLRCCSCTLGCWL